MPRISDALAGHRLATCLALILVGTADAALAGPPAPVELAARIDNHLAAKWEQAQVSPAPVVDDARFVRRAYLDLVGRIPTAAEARTFVADKSPEKRATLVQQLVGSGAHARHIADFWRRTWVPQSETGQYSRLAEEIEDWLVHQIRSEVSYAQLASALLTPSESTKQAEPWRLFYSASRYQPEDLAANTTRAFLGVNLDCAQCHDHPFARWTQSQFWETAAFFAKPGDGEQTTAKWLFSDSLINCWP